MVLLLKKTQQNLRVFQSCTAFLSLTVLSDISDSKEQVLQNSICTFWHFLQHVFHKRFFLKFGSYFVICKIYKCTKHRGNNKVG